MGKIALVGLSLALCGNAVAQARIGVGHPSAGPVGISGRHFGAGIVVSPRGFNRPYRRYGYPYPYGYGLYGAPYYYSDDYGPSEVEYRPETAPQVVPVVREKPEPLPDPVLLELHGNQWVKVGNFGEASQQALSSSSPTASAKEIPLARTSSGLEQVSWHWPV